MCRVDVTLTEDQRLLVSTTAALARRFATTGGVATDRASPDRIAAPEPRAVWRAVARMGLPGLLVPEHLGGTGACALDAALVMEELARRLVPVPLLGTLLAAALAVAAGGGAAVGPDLVGALATGERTGCVVLDEELLGLAPSGVAWDWSEGALVLAVDGGAVVETRARRPLEAIDPTRALARAGIDARERGPEDDDGRGRRLGAPTADRLTSWEALALALVCADLVGTLSGTLGAAVAHARVREQFGRPIGSFQAVQQLAAEHHVLVEAARSCMWHAAWAVDALAPDAAHRAASVAKAYCSEIARPVAEAAVQIWGGLGMTWECVAHLYLRRALLDRRVLGDEDHHLSMIADCGPNGPGGPGGAGAP
jgi:alkylation response protein AidB-like acyl-CoA dehydrogenase